MSRKARSHAIYALESKAKIACQAKQSEERDQALAYLSALFIQLSECIQHLAPEHRDAGEHFEELATMCNRVVVGKPPGDPYRDQAKF